MIAKLDRPALAEDQSDAVDLPEGWAVTTIGEVSFLNPPKPPRDALPPDEAVTFVPMSAVDADSGTIAAPSVRAFAAVRNGYTAFAEGDVIVAKITPCMENGKAAIVRGLVNGLGFGSTEFHVLRPTQAVVPEYVYHFVRQERFRMAAAAEMSGNVGQQRVPARFIEQASLPLPPLAEQRRIVDQIETLLASLDVTRNRLARVPAILKRFRQSVLAAACSGRLTEDWRTTHFPQEDGHMLVRRIRAAHAGLAQRGNAAPPNEDVHTLTQAELPEGWALTEL